MSETEFKLRWERLILFIILLHLERKAAQAVDTLIPYFNNEIKE